MLGQLLLVAGASSLNLFSVGDPRACRSILLGNIQGMLLAFSYYSNSFSIYKLIPETCSRAGEVTGWGGSKRQPLQLL